jgi:hypothetical protein
MMRRHEDRRQLMGFSNRLREMRTELTSWALLQTHPVWGAYEDDDSGVYRPVLDSDPFSTLCDPLIIKARFQTVEGIDLKGCVSITRTFDIVYLVEVFIDTEWFGFNHNLPDLAAEDLVRLKTALARPDTQIFPIRFHTEMPSGNNLVGEFTPFSPPKYVDLLEQRWRQSGTTEDDRNYLLALMHKKVLERDRVEMAAALGHAGAVATGVRSEPLPEHYRSRIERAVTCLEDREGVGFALDCALRVVEICVDGMPEDGRPRTAIDVTRRWLLDAATLDDVAMAAKNASEAAIEADDPDRVPADAKLTAAINAANSASHAALSAEYAAKLALGQDPGVGGVNDCVAWAAGFAAKAAKDPEAERKYQMQALTNYLLRRAKPLWASNRN